MTIRTVKKSSKVMSIIVFLLLYYIYMNPIRKVMIPLDGIVIPLILVMTFIIVVKRNHAKVDWPILKIREIAILWMIIGSYIFINNISLIDELIYGGMIQLYVMISFLVYVSHDENWFNTWIKWTKYYALFYAITTIVFYFNPGLYFRFIQFMYPDIVDVLRLFYNNGWMCGICDHFSTNGMVLAAGLMICLNELLARKEKRNTHHKQRIVLYVIAIIILYGLILSSKRAPLIMSLFAISFTYIIASGKNVFKRIIILSVFGLILLFIYEFLLPYIPGLSTIADKFQNTKDSDGGVLQGRLFLWEQAYKMINSAPILGHGYGSYSFYTKQMDFFTTSAHNQYLQTFAELGIIGLLLYAFAFLFAIQLTIKNLQKMVSRSNLVSPLDLLVMKNSLSYQIFVVLYSFSASTFIYYSIIIPYFLSVTASCILARKYKIVNRISDN